MDALKAANADTAKVISAEYKLQKAAMKETRARNDVSAAEGEVEAKDNEVLAEVRLAEANLSAANAELLRIQAEIKLAKLKLSLSKNPEEELARSRDCQRLDNLHKASILNQKIATADCHSFYKYLWKVSQNSLPKMHC